MAVRPRLSLVVLMGAFSWIACPRDARHGVGKVEVVGATVQGNALLGVPAAQVEELFQEALRRSSNFRIGGPGAGRNGGRERVVTLSLEIPFTRESLTQKREGRWAEVGASLSLSVKDEGGTARYEVVGLGEERIRNESDGRRAMQQALRHALEQVTESANLMLCALEKSDSQLERDLGEENLAIREFALRVLSERHSPMASDLLIARLRSNDLDQARWAMGALSEMREQRAVKPLIDLTRGRELAVVREVLFALAQIGGDEAKAYLYTVAQGHDDQELRAAAQKALGELERRRPNAAQTHGARPNAAQMHGGPQ